jgi:steroid delta-isomerase-like uncharacterized protein
MRLPAVSAEGRTTMATDNVALVRRYIEEIWNKGNLSVLGELVSDRYVATEPMVGELRGLDALRQHVQGFRTAFPDLRVTIDEIGLSGDRVFTRWTARGTHRGTFLGVAPTQNTGEVTGITVDHIASGKIVGHHESYDTLALLQTVGAVAPLERLVKPMGGAVRREQRQRQ